MSPWIFDRDAPLENNRRAATQIERLKRAT
jgi:hypothetical protein